MGCFVPPSNLSRGDEATHSASSSGFLVGRARQSCQTGRGTACVSTVHDPCPVYRSSTPDRYVRKERKAERKKDLAMATQRPYDAALQRGRGELELRRAARLQKPEARRGLLQRISVQGRIGFVHQRTSVNGRVGDLCWTRSRT